MSTVTFMHWYRPQVLGGETVYIVVAECSRCGLRVSAPSPDDDGKKLCANMLKRRCRRDEQNTYVTSILDALADA